MIFSLSLFLIHYSNRVKYACTLFLSSQTGESERNFIIMMFWVDTNARTNLPSLYQLRCVYRVSVLCNDIWRSFVVFLVCSYIFAIESRWSHYLWVDYRSSSYQYNLLCWNVIGSICAWQDHHLDYKMIHSCFVSIQPVFFWLRLWVIMTSWYLSMTNTNHLY